MFVCVSAIESKTTGPILTNISVIVHLDTTERFRKKFKPCPIGGMIYICNKILKKFCL